MYDENFYLFLFIIFKYIYVLWIINVLRLICMLVDLFVVLSKIKVKENVLVKEYFVENWLK